jgi:hypothetical protein
MRPGAGVRDELTLERLRALMREIARTAPRGTALRVYSLGGGTAVLPGWRATSIDADLFCPTSPSSAMEGTETG